MIPPFLSLALLVEVVEQSCGMATLQMGEFIPNATSGVDTYCIREPLGVCAGICPLNLPEMISLWVCNGGLLLILYTSIPEIFNPK